METARSGGSPRTHRRLLATILLFAALASACARTSSSTNAGTGGGGPFPLTLTDDDGVKVTIPHLPRRIVTFAPSLTEVVFALGLGDRLVGVSGKYDDFPAAARSIEEIGGSSGVAPDPEKVVSLHPDLFLAISGGEDWKGRLRGLGIPVFTLNSTSFDDVLHDMRTVGELTGTTERAVALTKNMSAQAREIQAAVANELRVTCFYEEFYSPPIYTVGPGSFIYDLLQRAGCDPVTKGARTAYPTWSVEALVKEDPAFYLVGTEAGATPAQVVKRPAYDALAAVRDGHVLLVNSDLLRPSPRVVEGLALLAHDLHPGAFA